MPTVEKSYCPGSGKPIPKKGYKTKTVRYYSVKYQCPECEGYFGMTKDRKLNRHGYALRVDGGQKVEGTLSICAECGGTIIGVDFLCEECRGRD